MDLAWDWNPASQCAYLLLSFVVTIIPQGLLSLCSIFFFPSCYGEGLFTSSWQYWSSNILGCAKITRPGFALLQILCLCQMLFGLFLIRKGTVDNLVRKWPHGDKPLASGMRKHFGGNGDYFPFSRSNRCFVVCPDRFASGSLEPSISAARQGHRWSLFVWAGQVPARVTSSMTFAAMMLQSFLHSDCRMSVLQNWGWTKWVFPS